MVKEVLLELSPVSVCGWEWQGVGDWWWLCALGALANSVFMASMELAD